VERQESTASYGQISEAGNTKNQNLQNLYMKTVTSMDSTGEWNVSFMHVLVKTFLRIIRMALGMVQCSLMNNTAYGE
jgi:hypothetical protein